MAENKSKGRFGVHGGQYIPETLMNAVIRNWKRHITIIKMIQNLMRNCRIYLTIMQVVRPDCILQRK